MTKTLKQRWQEEQIDPSEVFATHAEERGLDLETFTVSRCGAHMRHGLRKGGGRAAEPTAALMVPCVDPATKFLRGWQSMWPRAEGCIKATNKGAVGAISFGGEAAAEQSRLLVVEGAPDYLTARMLNPDDTLVLGASGASNTAPSIREALEACPSIQQVTVLLDGDPAGGGNMLLGARVPGQYGRRCVTVLPPTGKDLNDLWLEHGADAAARLWRVCAIDGDGGIGFFDNGDAQAQITAASEREHAAHRPRPAGRVRQFRTQSYPWKKPWSGPDKDDLLARITAADLAAKMGDPKKSGAGWLVSCPSPAHADAKPSCSVTDRNGVAIYKCFACGHKGNAITWWRERSGETHFPRVLEGLAAEFNLT